MSVSFNKVSQVSKTGNQFSSFLWSDREMAAWSFCPALEATTRIFIYIYIYIEWDISKGIALGSHIIRTTNLIFPF